MKKQLSLSRDLMDDPIVLADHIFQLWQDSVLDRKAINSFSNELSKVFNPGRPDAYFSFLPSTEFCQQFFDQLKNKFVDYLSKLPREANFRDEFSSLMTFSEQIGKELPDLKFESRDVSSDFLLDVLQDLPLRKMAIFLPNIYEALEVIVDSFNAKKVFDLLKKFPDELFDFVFKEKESFKIFQDFLPEMALLQDKNDNSLLFHLTRENKKFDIDRVEFYSEQAKKILTSVPDAKCFRSGRDIKNPLILMIGFLLDGEEINEQFLENNLQYLNQSDERGRTPLHYAVILGKNLAVQQLLQIEGIDFSIPDKSGRNAVHYSIIQNNFGIFDSIANSRELSEDFASALNQKDKFGLSSLAMAGFVAEENTAAHSSAKQSMIGKIIAHPGYQKSQNKFDKLFSETCIDIGLVDENGNVDLRHSGDLTQDQVDKLERKLSEIKNNPDIDDNTKKTLFCVFASYDNLELPSSKHLNPIVDFIPFGVELELVDLCPISRFPLRLFDKIYNVETKQDPSVVNSALMYCNENVQEIVSKPIINQEEFKSFFEMCEDLETSGAMVNHTTGLHIHINFNSGKYGKIVDLVAEKTGYGLNQICKERLELLLLKQIIANFVPLQQLLRGFIRNGNLFDGDLEYSRLVMDDEKKIKYFEKANSIHDIVNNHQSDFSGRNITLNLQNINSKKIDAKGTLEFRCHEGAINPIIIKAWANFVQRLINISIDQIADLVKDDVENRKKQLEGTEKFVNMQDVIGGINIKPKEHIEDLAYLLIADRRYQHTWDEKMGLVPSQYDFASVPILGGFDGASDSDPLAGKIAQVEIQNSLFYHSLQAGEILPGIKDPQDQKQLERMLAIQNKYPDILPDKKHSPDTSPSIERKDAIRELAPSEYGPPPIL